MNEAIIGKLFEQFKELYGATRATAASVFDGQRDLLTFVMGIGRELEQHMFDGLGTGYRGAVVERDGLRYRFKGYRRRQMQGLFGKVDLKRAYYVAGEGRTYSPLDCEVSAEGHTPGLQYYLSLFTGQNAYQEALDQFHRIFRPEGRDEISMRKALDMDYQLGERLEGLREQEIRQVLEQDSGIGKEEPIEQTMAVSIDATKVREKLGQKRVRNGRMDLPRFSGQCWACVVSTPQHFDSHDDAETSLSSGSRRFPLGVIHTRPKAVPKRPAARALVGSPHGAPVGGQPATRVHGPATEARGIRVPPPLWKTHWRPTMKELRRLQEPGKPSEALFRIRSAEDTRCWSNLSCLTS